MTKLYHEPMTHVASAIVAQGRVRTWLAKRVGVSNGQLTRILNGERRLQPEVARIIADSLGLPLEYVQPTAAPEGELEAVAV